MEAISSMSVLDSSAQGPIREQIRQLIVNHGYYARIYAPLAEQSIYSRNAQDITFSDIPTFEKKVFLPHILNYKLTSARIFDSLYSPTSGGEEYKMYDIESLIVRDSKVVINYGLCEETAEDLSKSWSFRVRDVEHFRIASDNIIFTRYVLVGLA